MRDYNEKKYQVTYNVTLGPLSVIGGTSYLNVSSLSQDYSIIAKVI